MLNMRGAVQHLTLSINQASTRGPYTKATLTFPAASRQSQCVSRGCCRGSGLCLLGVKKAPSPTSRPDTRSQHRCHLWVLGLAWSPHLNTSAADGVWGGPRDVRRACGSEAEFPNFATFRAAGAPGTPVSHVQQGHASAWGQLQQGGS